MISGILKSIIFGIIEGLTEFLPISSTGHLILLDTFLKLSKNVEFTNIFEVVIQSGAILSVIILYFSTIWPFKKGFKIEHEKLKLWLYIIIAFIPSAITGFFLKDMIQKYLFNPVTVCLTLFIYGVALIFIEKLVKKAGRKSFSNQDNQSDKDQKNESLNNSIINSISVKKSLTIGLFQILSMIPGTSRSAATIIGGILSGLSREEATKFSFFLAIPTIIGASFFSLLDSKVILNNEMLILLVVGFIVSFVVSTIVIKTFIKFIQKHDFSAFGWYRIGLSILVFVFLIVR